MQAQDWSMAKWAPGLRLPHLKGKRTTFLIPDYDEYGISYKDRSLYHHPKWKEKEAMTHADYFYAISVDGYLGGTWSKKLTGNKYYVETNPFKTLSSTQLKKVDTGVKAFHSFYSN